MIFRYRMCYKINLLRCVYQIECEFHSFKIDARLEIRLFNCNRKDSHRQKKYIKRMNAIDVKTAYNC